MFILNFLISLFNLATSSFSPFLRFLTDFKSDKLFNTEIYFFAEKKQISLIYSEYAFMDQILCIIHFCQNQNNHEMFTNSKIMYFLKENYYEFKLLSLSLKVLKIYIYKKWLYFLPIENFPLNNVAFLYKLQP